MKSIKAVFKVICKSLGFIALIGLYLFFIYWIETFHYLGSHFPLFSSAEILK